jgi:hypothetical protein
MHDIGHAADAELMQHAPTSGGLLATRIPELSPVRATQWGCISAIGCTHFGCAAEC